MIKRGEKMYLRLVLPLAVLLFSACTVQAQQLQMIQIIGLANTGGLGTPARGGQLTYTQGGQNYGPYTLDNNGRVYIMMGVGMPVNMQIIWIDFNKNVWIGNYQGTFGANQQSQIITLNRTQ